jgi:hypothetical protein
MSWRGFRREAPPALEPGEIEVVVEDPVTGETDEYDARVSGGFRIADRGPERALAAEWFRVLSDLQRE